MKIQGKVFVVTGGGAGIGREVVLLLLKRGAKVAAVDLHGEGLQETAKLAGNPDTLSIHQANITERHRVEELPAEIAAKFGPVDGLINVAGIIQPFVRVNDLSYADIERVMNVNFYGLMYMTKTFLPVLLARPEGHICNVSSMGAYAPVPGQSVYGASKAAVKLFTEGLRSELLGTSVGVTVVFPGGIATNITGNSGLHMEMPKDMKAPKTTPAPVAAKAMVDAIENNTPRVVIGQDAKTMDFLSRLNPVMAANMIYKQMANLLK
jgi:NAD(P)-dependent dehydrogenase (short-subunit alcohol dehydrogenase family)